MSDNPTDAKHPPAAALPPARAFVRALVERRWFQRSIITLIIINAVILGLETYPQILASYSALLHGVNAAVVVIFAIELLLRL